MHDAPKETVLNYAAPDLEKSRAHLMREMFLTALAIVGGFVIVFTSFLVVVWAYRMRAA